MQWNYEWNMCQTPDDWERDMIMMCEEWNYGTWWGYNYTIVEYVYDETICEGLDVDCWPYREVEREIKDGWCMEEGESWKRNSHLKRYAELKREKDQLIRKYLSKRGPSAEEMAEGGWVEPDIVECTEDCEGRSDSDSDEEVADEGFEPIPFYYDPVDYVIGLDFDWIEDKQDQLEDILDDDAEDLAEEIAELVEDFVD